MPAIPAIGVSSAGGAGEWSVGTVSPGPASGGSGGGFGGALSKAVSSLEHSQAQGSSAAQSLADGTATDPTSVVMAVEQARLAMQLASTLRNKGVEAVQEVFRTAI